MSKRIFVIFTAIVIFLELSKVSVASSMCDRHSQHQQIAQVEHSGHTHMEQGVVTQTTPTQPANVGNKICPVSGDKIDFDGPMKPAQVEYQGKIYNFCCEGCIAEFNKDPEKYIKKLEDMNEANMDIEGHHHKGHHHEMMHKEDAAQLSGTLENGIRIVRVRAFQYGFDPDPIVVKKGEKVRLEVTSDDVTHGLSIADFAVNVVVKKGETNTAEFVADRIGVFHIHCSVYCGIGHGRMHGALKIIE